MTQVGSTDNGRSHMTAVLGGPLGVLRALTRLNATTFYAYSIWHYPDGIDFYKVVYDEIEEYLQTAGSAERMTVEVREKDPDGGYVQYVLATEPITGEPSETIVWDGHSTQVHPEEVFTAEQAAPLFEEYFKTGRISQRVPRRELDLG